MMLRFSLSARAPAAGLALCVTLAALFLGMSCSSFAFVGRVKGTGNAVALEVVHQRLSDVTEADMAAVRVVEGRLPEGKFQRITEIDTTIPGGLLPGTFIPGYFYYSLTFANYRVFYPFREKWRRYVCWPQMPLQFVTLNLWSLMPTYWPCGAVGYGENTKAEVDARKALQITQLRRMAVALGGDTVLIEGWEDKHVVNDVDGRDKLLATAANVRAVVYNEEDRKVAHETRFPVVFQSGTRPKSSAQEGTKNNGKSGSASGPGIKGVKSGPVPLGADAVLIVQTGPGVQASFASLVENLLHTRLTSAGPFGMLPPLAGTAGSVCSDSKCVVARARGQKARVAIWVKVEQGKGVGFHLVAQALDTENGKSFRSATADAADFRGLAAAVNLLAYKLSVDE